MEMVDEIKEIEGIILLTKEKDNRYSIKLKPKGNGEMWFNGFGAIPKEAAIGEKVKIKYKEKKDENKLYRNIQSVEALDENPQPAEENATSKLNEADKSKAANDITMLLLQIRERAATLAANIYQGNPIKTEQERDNFIRLAQKIEKYMRGIK